MLPASSLLDGVHGVASNTVTASQFSCASPVTEKFSYLNNLGLCEFVFARPFAERLIRPASGNFVVHVVEGCPNVQVRGIDASANITGVQDVESFRHRTVGQHPRNTVRSLVSSFPAQHSVPMRPRACNPQPATPEVKVLIDPRPEYSDLFFDSSRRHSGLFSHVTPLQGNVTSTLHYIGNG